MADTSQRTVWYAYMSLVSLTGFGCTLQRRNDYVKQHNVTLPFMFLSFVKFWVWVLSQFELLSFFLSFVAFWVLLLFEFYHNLNFEFGQNLRFSVLSLFEFLSCHKSQVMLWKKVCGETSFFVWNFFVCEFCFGEMSFLVKKVFVKKISWWKKFLRDKSVLVKQFFFYEKLFLVNKVFLVKKRILVEKKLILVKKVNGEN